MRFVVFFVTLFLVLVNARLLGDLTGLHASTPSLAFGIATGAAIGGEIVYWTICSAIGKKWGALHLANGFTSVLVVGFAAMAALRDIGIITIQTGSFKMGMVAAFVGVVLALKVITALLVTLGAGFLQGAPVAQGVSDEDAEATV